MIKNTSMFALNIHEKSWSEKNLSLIYYTEVYSYLDQILYLNFSSGKS